MELLQRNVRPLYFKYLAAALGSALVGAVYTLVDMAVIGQYEGPNGIAAMAIVLPVWTLIASAGILTGIGGSVLYSTAKGKAENKDNKEANAIFTTAVIATAVLASMIWAALLFFDKQILMLLGAQDVLLDLGISYLKPLKVVIPIVVFSQMLAAFLRNDNNPTLATIAVVSTAILNIVGDYYFTFTLDMGIFGAALATATCSVLSVLIMLTHFISKKNTLKLVKPIKAFATSGKIIVTGFSTFFVDIAMGIMNVFFNCQILRYFGTDALAVYGAIASICTIVQCCSYSIGQAAQPIISINYGAGQGDRIKKVLKYAVMTSIVFGFFWAAVVLLMPNVIIRIFMSPTENVLAIAPDIMRLYCISFVLTPLNLFATYYFQSLMKPGISFGISVCRGLIVGGVLVFSLPSLFGANAIWLTMPICELLIAVAATCLLIRYTKSLKNVQIKTNEQSFRVRTSCEVLATGQTVA